MTHTEMCTVTACRTSKKCEKEATFFMASQVMRITLKAYDHQLVDQSAAKIIETVKKNRSKGERTGAVTNQEGGSNYLKSGS